MKGDKELIEEKCKQLGLELVDKDFDYDKNRDGIFRVRCLKCNRISTKRFVTLVKNNHGCRYCHDNNRDYKNSLEEVMPKILSACDECDYTFIGFENNEWKKCRGTKLILKCNKCGKITHKNYDNFINKRCRCICYRFERIHDVNALKDDKIYSKINKVCAKHNFTFIRFLSKDGKYHNNKTVLELKCNKCGKLLTYNFNHFTDRKLLKCKYCDKSLLETNSEIKLKNENIEFEPQKKFEWLKYKNSLTLDFFLPKYNLGIECQGKQHYEPVEFFGGEEKFKEQVKRDKIKNKLCEEHNIKLIYINSIDDIEKFRV
jgi:hypothetical protein